MCYEFDREYWLLRAEQARREMKKSEERLKSAKPGTPAKPAVPEPGIKQTDPVPA